MLQEGDGHTAKPGSYRYRSGRKWLSRRRMLLQTTIGGVSLAAASLLSCTQTKKPLATPSPQEPKRGGILIRQSGQETRGTGLDPHVIAPVFAESHRLFYQGLLGYDFRRPEEVWPELAHKWEQPSPTEYLFTLQPGIRWQNKPPANGRPLTAEDVVFSLERVRTKDPRFQAASIFDWVDNFDPVDKATVKITMKAPDAGLLMKLSGDSAVILAPEVVEQAGRFATADTAVGTGAFVLSSLEERVGAEYVRNPLYWKPGLPYLDSIRTRDFTDEKAAYAAFLAGQLDIASVVPGEEVKSYVARRGPGFQPEWFANTVTNPAWPNTKVKPMDDPRVTRALRLLIDHKEFNAHGELEDGRARHGSIFAPSLAAWDLTDEEYEKHLEWKPDKAEAVSIALDLLRAAGFNRENPLRFEVLCQDTERGLAATQLLAAQWRRLSQGAVTVTLKPADTTTRARLRTRGEFTYFHFGMSAAANEPDSWLSQLYTSNGSRNYAGYRDHQLDAMIERQRSLFKVEERKALVRELIVYAIDRWPGTIPFNTLFLNAVAPKVQGHYPEWRLNGRQYESVWLETA